jgi:hypothetical protein
MLSIQEHSKLLHDIKRAAKVLKFIQEEVDHDKRQILIGLMIDEMDRLSEDLEDLKEKPIKSGE